jgi:hypothetical protein
VYKRSSDHGATWPLPLSVFLQDPSKRAENGLCQSQAAPVLDPVTKTLIVGYTANGPGCQASSLGAKSYKTTPMLVNSTDDGLHWSKPYELMHNSLQIDFGPTFGPTKGLTTTLPTGGVRLMLPGENGWSATVFSDDAGATWQSNALNQTYTLSPGEMDWTICSKGTRCPPGMRFIMVSRSLGPCKTMCTQFSADGLVWTEPVATINGPNNILVGQGTKPGIVAVPGAFISSQTLMLCPTGVEINRYTPGTQELYASCGTPGTPSYYRRQPSDVLGGVGGMCLMISIDGIHWSLFKKTWPLGGMYTTAAGLTFDADGAALEYAVIFSGGSNTAAQTGNIMYMNFTAVHPNGQIDAELASAIAKLGGPQYVGSTKKVAAAPVPVPAPAAVEVLTSASVVISGEMLPDLDGSSYPRYTLAFQPGECTRNDGPGQHPLPPQPAPAPPPAPHQCTVHIHHSEGCFNYSDWKPGTPGKYPEERRLPTPE